MIAACLDISFISSWLPSNAIAVPHHVTSTTSFHTRPPSNPAVFDGPLARWYQTHHTLSAKCAFLLWHGLTTPPPNLQRWPAPVLDFISSTPFGQP